MTGSREEQHNVTPEEFRSRYRGRGNAKLHVQQYELALAGDHKLLLWLGKNRLDQSEPPPKTPEGAPNEGIKCLIAQIKEISEN